MTLDLSKRYQLTEMQPVLNRLSVLLGGPDVDGAINPTRKRLSQIIPDEKDWWHLYIDRNDHNLALALRKKNPPLDPGFLYDTQKSPGFQECMLDTYRKILDGDKFAEAFTPGNFTFAAYEEIYELIKNSINEDNRIPKEGIQFGMMPGVPAKDVFGEKVNDRALLGFEPKKFRVGPISYIANDPKPEDPTKSIKIYCLATVAEKKALIISAITTFNEAIVKAETRREQLRAIARFLRILHITHYFTDGNGRMHCYIMLPRLLLQCGFGPTLKLGTACAVDTLFSLFNGCFTVDEIVAFLWNAQQLDANFEITG